jgi:hypothetical protein
MSITRRHLLQASTSSLAAALASHWLSPSLARAANAPKATACIVLWLNGGPSHIDTFDPKPGQPTARFKSIKTRAKGLELSEHLPLLAEQASHLALVRSMTSREGNHDRARYLLHTGYIPNPTVRHPSLGGWISHEIGRPDTDIPNFISIGGPSLGAGFLGLQHGPFIVQDPSNKPENVAFAKDVDDTRFRARRAALGALEDNFAAKAGDTQVTGRRAIYEQAVRLMQSQRLSAFDVSQESEATRKAYGDNKFGKGCLVARRLVESGVKVVEVVLDGWDTHQDNFERTKKLMGMLDPAFSSLIKDLAARKLLDSTLVVCMGEFGRTPKINAQDGRDHYPAAWSAALAGGGIRGGIAYGKTDAEGAKVVENPVTVANLFATLVSQLGMDPAKMVTSPIGRPIGITEDGRPISALLT